MISLINNIGAIVMLTEIGAGVVSVVVPDKNGVMGDVVLGYRARESYYNDGPCCGKIPGRFANRISNASFVIDGKSYRLDKNKGKHHLHGGSNGFANREWKIVKVGRQEVTFALTSGDGDQGYPGELEVTATYRWSDDCTLSLELNATADRSTIINLTNHTYWNLSGEDSGSILSHSLQIFADKWLPTDVDLIPTGEILSVEGTPMDFRKTKKIGEDIHSDFQALKYGKGYDNCWVLRGGSELKKAVVLSDDRSGRSLEVWTTQPAVQIYTGNWLAGSPLSKSGRSYNDYDGVAIECQNYPDAPNKEEFPGAELRKGELYSQRIEFRLGH